MMVGGNSAECARMLMPCGNVNMLGGFYSARMVTRYEILVLQQPCIRIFNAGERMLLPPSVVDSPLQFSMDSNRFKVSFSKL